MGFWDGSDPSLDTRYWRSHPRRVTAEHLAVGDQRTSTLKLLCLVEYTLPRLAPVFTSARRTSERCRCQARPVGPSASRCRPHCVFW